MGRCLAWHLIVDGVKTESARGGLKRKCLFWGRFRRDSSYGKYPLLRRKGYAGAKADQGKGECQMPGPGVRHTGPNVCAYSMLLQWDTFERKQSKADFLL